ncbi:MAG: ferrous iron transport protein A [Myxococcota bacterium]
MSSPPFAARRRDPAPSPSPARLVRLVDLPAGVPARLCNGHAGLAPAEWLVALGFVPGTPIRIIRGAPLGGPVEMEIRGTRVCARRSDLSGFSVIPENDP